METSTSTFTPTLSSETSPQSRYDTNSDKKRTGEHQEFSSTNSLNHDTNKRTKLSSMKLSGDLDSSSSRENRGSSLISVRSINDQNFRSNTLDGLPIEVLLDIYGFVGKYCYTGFGAVNKQINHMFKTYNLPKESSYIAYTPLQDVIDKFEVEFDEYNTPQYYCEKIAVGIVFYRRKDLFEWAMREENRDFLIFGMYSMAAYYGNTVYLERLFGDPKFDVWDKHYLIDMSELCNMAAMGGQVECLKYLREKYNCSWTSEACDMAACYGKLNCLIYLHEIGCEWGVIAPAHAASGGYLECLIYLHKHGCEWDKDACSGAAGGGHLDCLKYLHENGCEWNHWSYIRAARRGRLECLKYLHENGCPWESIVCERAAEAGQLECLRYMRDQGLEWSRYEEFLENHKEKEGS